MISDSPHMQRERDMLAQAIDNEAQEGRLFRELTARCAPVAPSPRQAVLEYVARGHEIAAAILRSPQDYPAHAVDFALGVLSEAAAFVQADRKAPWD
jgi:hypothetical protein